ncbi:DUF4214 domain-containing protein [Massilia sp. TS11]|uniref:DUF4214 domain-containing protein n=1 Tax=Massilia sp. TS11 TaxID=2908003 RepID=UPI001ED9EF5C|nr:DUF4214 domain-containing protein [Massilia sp. TS11]MCG2585087.1 DUF4214 domain-containing protein [Massilia sp. TS11]
MATVSDISKVPLSGYNWIDALLDNGPHWNFLTPDFNTIYYTFSVASNNEANNSDINPATRAAFSATQQANARLAMAYLTAVTGIQFVETTDAAKAQVHLCDVDITTNASTSGLCSWTYNYNYDTSTNVLTSYSATAYVYIDNKEWASQNGTLAQGSYGYETLLHELGHMLGLKHPFEGTTGNSAVLPAATDSTAYTLMAYNESGGPYTSFRAYDLAALNWLYGGDGLAGKRGVGAQITAYYLTGTSGNDMLTGSSGDDLLEPLTGSDTIDGGDGTDTLILSGVRASYVVKAGSNGSVLLTGTNTNDVLRNIENIKFADMMLSVQSLLAADTTPPDAPTISANLNAAGYLRGGSQSATVSGKAEAGSTVQVYQGAISVGSTTASASGDWSLTTLNLGEGSFTLAARATDAAGNSSAFSAPLSFKIDVTPPSVPTLSVAKDASGVVSTNLPVFSGKGEINTSVQLIKDGVVVGTAAIGADNSWSAASTLPLANGSYSLTVRGIDAAENLSAVSSALTFSINSSANKTYSAGADSIALPAASGVLDGGAGLDTLLVNSAFSAYSLKANGSGFVLSGAGLTDVLANIERINFSDKAIALDINGTGGQAFRIYQAAFNRVPDLGGLGYWMKIMDNGASLKQVAGGFISSQEFASVYGGANPSDSVFVTKLYNNVLHRDPDSGGYNFWMAQLANGGSRAEVLAAFSESPENQSNVIGLIGNGFEYTPYLG